MEKLSLVTAMKSVSGVPAEHDGKLLASSRNALGRPLSQPEKASLRRVLKTELGL